MNFIQTHVKNKEQHEGVERDKEWSSNHDPDILVIMDQAPRKLEKGRKNKKIQE